MSPQIYYTRSFPQRKGGGGGISWEFVVIVVVVGLRRQVLYIQTLFQTKKMYFSIHTRF